MLNTTILSLHVMSLASKSSFMIATNMHNSVTKTIIFKSSFSHFFTSVFSSYTTKHKSIFQETRFSHSLETPLVFESEYNCAINTSSNFEIGVVHNRTISPANSFVGWAEQAAFYLLNCGDVIIQFCTFEDCHSIHGGGSIRVVQNCTVFIHSTQFKRSRTSLRKGATIYAVRADGLYDQEDTDDKNVRNVVMNDTALPALSIQNCCFSDCYPEGDQNLYGVCLYSSAKDTILFMSSAVNCPGTDKKAAEGAQFDMQAEIVKSKNVNITGGKAKFCAGIEYRYARKGYFLYQSISNIEACMFATAFTDINVKDIEISFCNYDNNNLIYSGKANDVNLFPGLIHARFNDVIIDTFCFTHFRDSTNKGKIISRGTEWHNNTGDWNNYEQLIKITVKNCYADESVRGHPKS